MYFEIVAVSCAAGLIASLAWAATKRDIYFIIMSICFVGCGLGIVGVGNSWQHETKTIVVLDKMIVGDHGKIVGDGGIIYDAGDLSIYSKLKVNGSYTVEVAHNYDNKNNGGYIYHNIDRVLT